MPSMSCYPHHRILFIYHVVTTTPHHRILFIYHVVTTTITPIKIVIPITLMLTYCHPQLESALPETHQCYDWRLLYRLTRDGASLHTLLLHANAPTSFSRGSGGAGGGAGKYQSTLVVVKDAKGAIFGGFLTEPLRGIAGAGGGSSHASGAIAGGSGGLIHHHTATSHPSSSTMHGLTHGSQDK